MAVDVLIVDDSDMFRALIRRHLERFGCQIAAEASNSTAGLEHFRTLRPKIVTLDLMMPDDPAFGPKELFSVIRQESPETAIFVISVQSRDTNAADFLARGAIAYVEKSFMRFDGLRLTLERLFPELIKKPSGLAGRVRRF